MIDGQASEWLKSRMPEEKGFGLSEPIVSLICVSDIDDEHYCNILKLPDDAKLESKAATELEVYSLKLR